MRMKLAAKIFLAAVLPTIVLILIFVYLDRSSEQAVIRIVGELGPGTPFSEVTRRLGVPSRSDTNVQEIVQWVERLGARADLRFATNSNLHTFVHRGPPYRFVLVFTDRESNSVSHATWRGM